MMPVPNSLRILHLAYEDPQQPGSGGGSVRTREINRRLSRRHDITALVAGYPHASRRDEEGVHWRHTWPHSGGKIDRLAYFAQVGPMIRREAYDLIVEEFGAPFSTALAPLYTRRPVVASVQWMFAAQMRTKYRLPFDWVERLGLRLYRDFITVSAWERKQIRERRPNVLVESIPNGVDDGAFSVERAEPTHLLYLGRLDVVQKGGDLLLDSYAQLLRRTGGGCPPLLVVGDGPDGQQMMERAERLGIDRRVDFRGRVDGVEKFHLMAQSHAVLMPSRFETFGIVAAEALAVGVPLVTFDVGPLREVAGGGGARLVPAFDLDAFTNEVLNVIGDRVKRERAYWDGRAWAERYRWDAITQRQEAHYLRAVERSRSLIGTVAEAEGG